jgi:hypothetical protein
MQSLIRVFVSSTATVATFYFMFWLPFSLILPPGRFLWIRVLGSLACAAVVGRYTWRQTASASHGPVRYIFLGAVITGGIGFSAGFFGPLILNPGANQGPLPGIFITGPLGFLAGAVGGAIYWSVRGKRLAEDLPDRTRTDEHTNIR